MHTKGMVFHTEERNIIEKYLTNNMLSNHKKALSIFNKNKNIDKIGTLPAYDGFMWFNFFYVRGDYLQKCSPPKISTDRYYYEIYLGIENKHKHNDDAYSLYANEIKTYSNSEASTISLSF